MKTKQLTFLLALTFLFLFSCSEPKTKPKIEYMENPEVKKSFDNYVLPILNSLDVGKLQDWGFEPYYDYINDKLEKRFRVKSMPHLSQTKTEIKLGLMDGYVWIKGSEKVRDYFLPMSIFIRFVKLSSINPWKLVTNDGYVVGFFEPESGQPPEFHIYLKSKF